MVEVSNLLDLDIYTMAGSYEGRVKNVVLNMRLGTISKFQVKVLNHETEENGDLSITDVIARGLWLDSDEGDNDNDDQDLFNIDYDEVKAIGDIILIEPQDFEEQN